MREIASPQSELSKALASSDEREWLPRLLAAKFSGVSAGHFNAYVRPLIPPEAIRGNRTTLLYHGPTVVQVRLDQKLAEQRKQATDGDGDPLLDGADSPGLERYRNAKADLTEMERDVQRGVLIPRSEIEPTLIQYGGVMRKAGERLRREFGNPAGDIITDALDDFDSGIGRLFKRRDTGDDKPDPQAVGREPAAASAVDA